MTETNPISENIGLHRFAIFAACSTIFLIFLGGLVTSTESGLSVPDWPTTYGWNMFTFPVSKWVGGIFYEHTHRLVASFVGFLTVILAVWTWRKEPRAWVRKLAIIALAVVIAQGILGGLTVRYFLPPAISTAHACLAQTFFCLIISIALFTSPAWKRGLPGVQESGSSLFALPVLCALTTAAVFIQLILGAYMRHSNAGLAIPDFPLMFGGLLPPFTSGKIIIHFAHRMGALVVTTMVVWTFLRIYRNHSDQHLLWRPALIMILLLSLQLTLGALTVWTAKAITPTTTHVATGALILGTTFLLTLRAFAMVSKRQPGAAYPLTEPAWK